VVEKDIKSDKNGDRKRKREREREIVRER